jgi:hypothetical protein
MALFLSFNLGANGRSCSTCHRMCDGMTVSLSTIKELWRDWGVVDPIFNASDGSNRPSLPQALPSRHSILLNHGAFRISLPWPPRSSDGNPIVPYFDSEVLAARRAGSQQPTAWQMPQEDTSLLRLLQSKIRRAPRIGATRGKQAKVISNLYRPRDLLF